MSRTRATVLLAALCAALLFGWSGFPALAGGYDPAGPLDTTAWYVFGVAGASAGQPGQLARAPGSAPGPAAAGNLTGVAGGRSAVSASAVSAPFVPHDTVSRIQSFQASRPDALALMGGAVIVVLGLVVVAFSLSGRSGLALRRRQADTVSSSDAAPGRSRAADRR